MKITKKQLKQIIKEELTYSSIGSGRDPEEVFTSINESLQQAHKDLQMLSLHLKNGGFDVQPTEDLLKTVERVLVDLDGMVKQDVQDLLQRADDEAGRNPGGSIG